MPKSTPELPRWKVDPVEEAKAAHRISATTARWKRTPDQRANAADKGKQYRARPEVVTRKRIARQVWRAKNSIPSTVIPYKLGVRVPEVVRSLSRALRGESQGGKRLTPTPQPSTAATAITINEEDF